MDVIKKTDQVILTEDNKLLKIQLMNNGDLYWKIDDNKDSKIKLFEIKKKDYQVYELFEILYNDIKNKNIYNIYNEINMCTSKEQIQKVYNSYEQEKNYICDYEDINSDLSITWVSDNNYYNISNFVTILKEDDKFRLIFNLRDYQSRNVIQFSNSCSRYKPYNICFMKHFRNLYNLEINKNQIHIDEYLYLKKVKKI